MVFVLVFDRLLRNRQYLLMLEFASSLLVIEIGMSQGKEVDRRVDYRIELQMV